MEDPLAARRRRFLALAEDLPERCRLVESGEGNPLLRKLQKLALFRGRYVRWAAARAGLKSGVVDVRLFWGRRMRLPYTDDADFVSFYLAGSPGGPEYKLVRYFIRTLKPDDVFYDAGANYGFYTALAGEFIGPIGELHAFEPLPEIHAWLARNTPPGARVVDSALWDRSGTATLYRHRLGNAFGTLEAEAAEREAAPESAEVRCTTLDEYAKERRAPTVIKIDVEGGEKRLIAGGLETLRRSRPVVTMEVWAGERGERFSAPACRLLLELGYTAHALRDDGTPSPIPPAGLEGFMRNMPFWDNFVFLPA